ncbi:MAG: histidine kinase dimerization/phospho-acceptor domain-containing protein [Sneathiellaceae bacterium]
MLVYTLMDALPRPSSYLGKILTISFLGVHLPMVGAVLYVLLSADVAVADSIDILVALLIATLLGTTVTLAAIYALLAPISAAALALRAYLEDRRIPSLPTRHRDRAGVLMANVQEAITRLDVTLDAVETQRDEALRTHREKFDLLASMSHDLRTPLNHVIGFAELISAEALGPLGTVRYRSYADDIRSSGGDLLATLQNLLDLSAVESGRVAFEATPQNLSDAARRAVNLMHHQAEHDGVRLDTDFDGQSDLLVLADGRSLKQILMHGLSVLLGQGATAAVVRIAADPAAGIASIMLQSDAPWGRHDVPPEMLVAQRSQLSGAPLDVGDFQSSNPTALRLSLLDSLARLTNARLRVGSAGATGRQLRIVLPLAPAAESLPAA